MLIEPLLGNLSLKFPFFFGKCLIFLLLVYSPGKCWGQILSLHPAIGDTISLEEKVKFSLFPFCYQSDFKEAMFLKVGQDIRLVIRKVDRVDTILCTNSDFLQYQRMVGTLNGDMPVKPTKQIDPVKREFVRKKNSIYSEIFGSSLLLSFNYSRIIYHNKKISLEPRIGLMLVPGILVGGVSKGPVAGMDVLIGNKRHSLEFGMSYGGVYEKETKRNGIFIQEAGSSHLISGRIGYRYNAYKGFLFRTGLTPMKYYDRGYSEFVVIPSLILGKTF